MGKRCTIALGLTTVLDVGGHARCSRPSLVVLWWSPHHEVVAGSPVNLLDQAHNIFVVDGRGESTHKPPTISCQLPLAGNRLLECDRNAPVAAAVVSALLGGCNTTGSLPSTRSSEPGADKAADPASTLLVSDPATPLLVALGFPSKPLIVLLSVVWAGVGVGVWAGAGASLSTRPQPKRNPKN